MSPNKEVGNIMSKEELEELFGVPFLDYEVEIFNNMLDARKKGQKIYYYPARQNIRKINDCINVYEALKRGIKVDQIFFDELIGDSNDR